MKECLILGLGGSGKTSVIKELQRQGRTAYDADDTLDPITHELGGWFTLDGQPRAYNSDHAWRRTHQFLWDIERIQHIVKERKGNETLYFAGLATNMRDAVPLFDRVLFLDAGVTTLHKQLTRPDRNTPYSFEVTEEYVAELTEAVPRFRASMKKIGAYAINAEQELVQVGIRYSSLCREQLIIGLIPKA